MVTFSYVIDRHSHTETLHQDVDKETEKSVGGQDKRKKSK
jgi:hypothetical protein